MRSLSGQTWGSGKTTQLMIQSTHQVKARLRQHSVQHYQQRSQASPGSNPSSGTEDLQ